MDCPVFRKPKRACGIFCGTNEADMRKQAWLSQKILPILCSQLIVFLNFLQYDIFYQRVRVLLLVRMKRVPLNIRLAFNNLVQNT